jgi:hypothetical protein
MNSTQSRYLSIFTIGLLSFYCASVSHNYFAKKSFDRWHDTILENQYAQEEESETPFIVKKMDQETLYVNETLYAELECVDPHTSLLIPIALCLWIGYETLRKRKNNPTFILRIEQQYPCFGSIRKNS